MVLGLRTKTRRGPTVQADFLIHIQEIKPWPPSQSLKSIRSVVIQWENGDKNSGSTSSAVPSLTDGKIEFNESFKLPATLLRDMSVKNGDVDTFHKNLLEFNLYELRRDQTVKGQLLGTAIYDLADSGNLKETTAVTIPVNCTRSFRNTAQAVLHFRIQPVDKARSLRSGLQKEGSVGKNGGSGSVSSLMNDEYSEEADFASLTDDDVSSSHSSLANSSVAESSGSVASPNGENEATTKDNSRALKENQGKSKLALEKSNKELVEEKQRGGSTHPSRPEDLINSGKLDTTISSSTTGKESSREASIGKENLLQNSGANMPHMHPRNGSSSSLNVSGDEYFDPAYGSEPRADDGYQNSKETMNTFDIHNGEAGDMEYQSDESNMQSSGGDTVFSKHRSKHVRSMRSPLDSSRSNGSIGGGFATTERKEAKVYPSDKKSNSSESKVKVLEQKVKMLEGELREAAALEVSLYMVVAEHGSSGNKVHAPARRLSRLYLQAGKGNIQVKRASVARSVVSGLIVVAKACGNDVPRLTFWLSNCAMLRAIIRQAPTEKQSSDSVIKEADKRSASLGWKASSSYKGINTSFSGSLNDLEDPRRLISALEKVESWIFSRIVESVWWQTLTPHMQSSATKVVDKTMGSGSKKSVKRQSSSSNQEQVNLSLELWKKAFRDACERLCPVRAAGHECGCLPILSKLIMEQCVARLDVAMFNAILRESGDEIPTDPMSDPISDARVLPIQTGKSSFGAGAQLKNAIGNWSRWLSDLFGMDDDESDLVEDEDHTTGSISDDERQQKLDSSFKSFHLLKSLSDLMMLPKDMLLNSSIRKEVCPAFSVQLIKRILENFVPDEFCPDPIPAAVVEALDSEDVTYDGEDVITNLPCSAPSAEYMPPRASSLACIMGDAGSLSPHVIRRSSSVLRKSNTSDDELDELESPLDRVIAGSHQASSPTPAVSYWNTKEKGAKSALRYQLLREVWMNSD